jgi:hypothetical protein
MILPRGGFIRAAIAASRTPRDSARSAPFRQRQIALMIEILLAVSDREASRAVEARRADHRWPAIASASSLFRISV